MVLKVVHQKLRRERRALARSTFSVTSIPKENQVEETLSSTSVGPTTRSKTKVKRSDRTTIPSTSPRNKEKSPPTTQDSQGRELFTRPSDGKLVYLQCCIAGCGRTNFPTARALRNHICSPSGLHKIVGLIKSNSHAIEICGQIAPCQDELPTIARYQTCWAAPVANMARVGLLPSPPTGSDEYHRQSKASSRSISDTEAKSGATLPKTLESLQAQDLGRAYRTRVSNSGSQTEPKTRPKEAAEIFNGFMSSDSEDSDESEDGPLRRRNIPADRIDQHKAANRAVNPSTVLRASKISSRHCAKTAEGDSAVVILAVDNEAMKKERSASPLLLLPHLERHATPKILVAATEAKHFPNFQTKASHLMPDLGIESIATRKRANSAPPVTPPAITKRLRVTYEDSERLVRSYSRGE